MKVAKRMITVKDQTAFGRHDAKIMITTQEQT